ncbi:MAG: hypothetical protein ACM4D3_03970 [Candidatus Sericytochromatia bacterium]
MRPSSAGGECLVRPLGRTAWTGVEVVWRDENRDLALLAAPKLGKQAGVPPSRWRRIDGLEPVACTRWGFPWAQARPEDVWNRPEQLFGVPHRPVGRGQDRPARGRVW